MVAANSIAGVVKNLAVVLCVGVGSGGSVLIGKYLGEGNLARARSAGAMINRYAVAFGAGAAVAVLIASRIAG